MGLSKNGIPYAVLSNDKIVPPCARPKSANSGHKRKAETKRSFIKEAMRTFAVKQVPKYIEGDPNEKLPRLMELADTFSPEGWYGSRRSALCTVITGKND